MIKNDRELVVAKEQVEHIIASNNKLQENASQLTNPVDNVNDNSILLQNLTYEIAEYNALVAHDPENQILLELRSPEEINELPIKASIAFKITPQELTEICKQEEQAFDSGIDSESQNSSEFFKAIKVLGVQLIDDLFFVAKMSNDLKQKLQSLRMEKQLCMDG
jgi:ATP-dependent 26S proteasome regulatory subunit